MYFEYFGLLVASLGLGASAAVLPRQGSVHLAVSPTCGTLSGSPASINAGLNDLSSYKTIVAFGDSYTSGGTDGTTLPPAIMTPPNPSAGGRVSNGKLWIEHLANAAGATLHDYAVNGSVIDALEYPSGSVVRNAKDYMSQVDSYLSDHPKSDPDTTLYVVFVGMGDFENRDELVFQNFSLTTGAITYSIAELTSGSDLSKHFLFVDNYGRGQKTSDGEVYKQALFNNLKDAKNQLGISFGFVDLYPLWNGVLGSNPGYEAFGFTSPGSCTVNDQTTDGACEDPEHTFYWIPGHPSASTHSITAQYVQEAMSECNLDQ
ncbi:hypothetical protein K435DRAFT_729280 [Dendrothele bispora CBS 962.96]|uniref:Carbohydrate esterase family 16 protein n=1 Tax=Dendrothele bispora (strain CBS 962.96) TaxID=1314807 RepID=A0A4S8LKA7_DENBC|nr:hypothetical protein K435DRAFT_729280 [Dendrothele bispora CBS 962.96]